MSNKIRLRWSNVRWYQAVVDLDEQGLTRDDFPLMNQNLSEDVMALLCNLEPDHLIEVDGVEITRIDDE
jgi:hypothetical protein